MSSEIWKDIEDFEGLYQVSNKGRFKRLYKETVAKNGVIMRFKEKILSNNSLDVDGYVVRILTKNKKPHTRKGHRLVAKEYKSYF